MIKIINTKDKKIWISHLEREDGKHQLYIGLRINGETLCYFFATDEKNNN